MLDTDRFPQVEVRSRSALRSWLAAHHAQTESVWLVTFLKHTGASYVSREEVLDELLCFGWIDGIRRKLDAERTMQLISPRRTQAWTATYRARATRLEAEGRMADPGRRAIAQAKANGGWGAHPQVDALVVPSDVLEALEQARSARAWFEASAPSYRRNVLRWIVKAQRADTRARRVATLVATAARGERIPNL